MYNRSYDAIGNTAWKELSRQEEEYYRNAELCKTCRHFHPPFTSIGRLTDTD